MIQHNGPISGVTCSEKFVATAGYDNQVILWDAKNQASLARGLHDHLANRCEISADEKYLVSASSDYSARIWELPDMKLKAVLNGHTDDVETARFSPNSRLVATTSQDGRVRVFDLSGRITHEFVGHRGCSQSVAWSADGCRLVSSGDDGTIRTWHLESEKEESVVKPENVQTDAVVVCATGVVFAGNDTGDVIRIENGQLTKISAHQSGVKNLAINQNGTTLASVSYDRDLTLIDIRNKMFITKKIALPPLVWARACAFYDNNTLIFGTFGSTYARLNLNTEEWAIGGIKSTSCLNAVMVDGDTIYSVGDSGIVRRADRTQVESAVDIREPVADMGSLCNFVLRFKERIVCGGHLGIVFDAQTGEELLRLKRPINKAVQAGPFLVLATYSGELAICKESAQGRLELLGEFRVLQNAIKDLSVEGSIIFCCGAAADIALFDLQSLRRISVRTGAHDNIVNSCVALGNGVFATVSRDLRLKIWRGLEAQADLETPFSHSIKCASVSDDRRYIGAVAYDGTVAIYDRNSGSWPAFRRLTAAGLSSLTFAANAFWASSYDGRIYKVDLP